MNVILLLLSILFLSGCSSNSGTTLSVNNDFLNSREVSIVGYSGDAMEPFISRDGNILFFNNLNQPYLPDGTVNDTNIHYAVRVDDVTFEYKGPVSGAATDNIGDTNELEAVPSMDDNGKFYFINTMYYLDENSPDYLRSIFRADFSDGVLSDIESLPNLKADRPANQNPAIGELDFGVEIDPSGNILYFDEGIFTGNPFPDESDIGIAVKNSSGEFTVDPDSDYKMENINTDALEYASSISSDSTEIFFTRYGGGTDFGIYSAVWSPVSGQWTDIRRIEAITGDTTEAPAISPDGHLLYYHKRVDGRFRIFVVER